MGYRRPLKIVLTLYTDNQDKNVSHSTNASLFDYMYLEYSKFLTQGMGFSYSILTGEPGGKHLPNGEWAGVIGMVQRGEADLAVSPLVITKERLTAVNFSYPFFVDSVAYVVRKVEIPSGLSTILQPFAFKAWTALLISSVSMSFLLYPFLKKERNFLDILLKITASIFRQPIAFPLRERDKRVLFSPWLLGLMFLSNCYISLVLSFMTFPRLSVVRDISELAKEVSTGRYRVMVRASSPFAEIISSSEHEEVKTIGESIYKNPEGFGSIDKFLHSSDPNVAFIELGHRINYLNSVFFISKDYFFSIITAIAVGKDFCCRKKLDMVIHRIAASGLYEKLLRENDFQDAYLLFSKVNFRRESPRPLTLSDLSGAFITVITGHSIGFVLLLFEMVINVMDTY